MQLGALASLISTVLPVAILCNRAGVPAGFSESIPAAIISSILFLTLLLPNQTQWSSEIHLAMICIACACLGVCMGIALQGNATFCYFIVLFCYFHVSEFTLITISHGQAKFDSLLLNHGIPYASAFAACTAEHFISPFHLPFSVSVLGGIVAVFGLSVRAVALITGGKSFTHLISTKRESGHELITSGIYSQFRHPGYCGWFYWVVGAQMLAGNLVCTISFGIVTWRFFKDRIEYEERLLLEMFGDHYVEYYERTKYSGVPFIS